MFRVRYLLGVRNRLEENIRRSFGSTIVARNNTSNAAINIPESNIDMFDDDMGRLQEIAPDDYMSHRRELPEQERDPFQFPQEIDHTEWLNPYEQDQRDYMEDYAWEMSFYEIASTGDQYW